MEIRDATSGDVHGIRHVAVESWHEAYDGIIGQDAVAVILDDWYDPDDLRESIERSTGERSTGHFLVADQFGTVVGYAQGVPSEQSWGDAFIPRLYVDPFHWGEGIGSALLEALFGRFRAGDHERVWLEVLEQNEVGVSFYKGWDFAVVRERTADMEGRMGAEYVMARDL